MLQDAKVRNIVYASATGCGCVVTCYHVSRGSRGTRAITQPPSHCYTPCLCQHCQAGHATPQQQGSTPPHPQPHQPCLKWVILLCCQVRPLDYLVQRAAVDGSTQWRRCYQLGSKAELLVVVSRPEGEGQGPIKVTLTTDAAAQVVLHWGVCKPGG